MKRNKSKLLFTALLMTISSGAIACECLPNDSIVKEYNDADIVFNGKVVKIDSVFSLDSLQAVISSKNRKPHTEVFIRKYISVQFKVTRFFKGDSLSGEITIITPAYGPA